MGLENLIQKVSKKASIGLIGGALTLSSLTGCFSIGEAIGNAIREQGTSEKYFFACNYLEDINHNGEMEYPNEFVGIKSTFRDNEEIILIGMFKTKAGQTYKLELYSPKGDIVSKETRVITRSNETMGLRFHNPKDSLSEDEYGIYHATWYLDNQLVGATHFNIVPSK